MAIGGVVIQFFVDGAKAVRGIKGVSTELGKVDEKAGRSETALDGVQREFDATGAASERAADEVRREALNMADGVRAGAVGIDAETDRMRRDMGEVGRESGAEFVNNIAEGIGSGQANLSDVVSGTLGGLPNLAATLTGPVGIAAGAAAAGIGLVFAKVKAESEDAHARLDSMRGALEGVGAEGQKVA